MRRPRKTLKHSIFYFGKESFAFCNLKCVPNQFNLFQIVVKYFFVNKISRYDFDKTISMFQNEIPHSRRHEVITFFNTLLASVAFRQNAYRISQLNQAEFHKFFVQNFDSFARIVSSEKRRLASRKPRGRSVSNDLESPIVFVFHCA